MTVGTAAFFCMPAPQKHTMNIHHSLEDIIWITIYFKVTCIKSLSLNEMNASNKTVFFIPLSSETALIWWYSIQGAHEDESCLNHNYYSLHAASYWKTVRLIKNKNTIVINLMATICRQHDLTSLKMHFWRIILLWLPINVIRMVSFKYLGRKLFPRKRIIAEYTWAWIPWRGHFLHGRTIKKSRLPPCTKQPYSIQRRQPQGYPSPEPFQI